MNAIGNASVALSVLLAALAGGCSSNNGDSNGGSSGASGGAMFVRTCSLGCNSGQGGVQVSCSVVEAFVNQEIAITFSDAVAPSSLDTASFQLIDVDGGQVPVGT